MTALAAQPARGQCLRFDVANRLKILRIERGLTQRQVADGIGTTKQQYGRLENSVRRLADHWVRPLAEFFEVHPGALWENMPARPLTEDETRLLHAFRQLDERKRQAASVVIDALAKTPSADRLPALP